jgi:very-long-chain (3R)-3-hydroxyacyl-CoA dehydratase
MSAATAPRSQLQASSGSAKNKYLISYNAVSCGLWAVILYRTIRTSALHQEHENLYKVTGTYTRWTQTVALVEVLHSLLGEFELRLEGVYQNMSSCRTRSLMPMGWKNANRGSLGIVRAPIFTTLLQVASRVVLIWGIVEQFPVETNPAYSTMLLAWSATEVVRYSYFVFNLTGRVPPALSWLRYNLFFVLYPLGISSEAWLVYKSVPHASKQDPRLGYLLYAILGIYVPGKFLLVPQTTFFLWEARDPCMLHKRAVAVFCPFGPKSGLQLRDLTFVNTHRFICAVHAHDDTAPANDAREATSQGLRKT